MKEDLVYKFIYNYIAKNPEITNSYLVYMIYIAFKYEYEYVK